MLVAVFRWILLRADCPTLRMIHPRVSPQVPDVLATLGVPRKTHDIATVSHAPPRASAVTPREFDAGQLSVELRDGTRIAASRAGTQVLPAIADVLIRRDIACD